MLTHQYTNSGKLDNFIAKILLIILYYSTMNLVELLVELHINLLVPIKKAALKFSLTLSQTLCIISIPFDGISQSKLTKKLCLDLSTLTRNLD